MIYRKKNGYINIKKPPVQQLLNSKLKFWQEKLFFWCLADECEKIHNLALLSQILSLEHIFSNEMEK